MSSSSHLRVKRSSESRDAACSTSSIQRKVLNFFRFLAAYTHIQSHTCRGPTVGFRGLAGEAQEQSFAPSLSCVASPLRLTTKSGRRHHLAGSTLAHQNRRFFCTTRDVPSKEHGRSATSREKSASCQQQPAGWILHHDEDRQVA